MAGSLMTQRKLHGSRSGPQNARVFVINLEEDQDRLQAIDGQLARLGIRYERFPGFRGAQLPPWLREQFFDEHDLPNAGLGPGEIGCYASHLGLYGKIVEERVEGPVLVLEDDAQLGSRLPEVLANLHSLPKGWDIVRLSGMPHSAYVSIASLTREISVVRYWRIPTRTTGYFINRQGAERILFAKKRRFRPVDHDLRRSWGIDISIYGLIPPPISHGEAPSLIDRIGHRNKKKGGKSLKEKAIQLGDALRIHGPYVGARCILANLTSSVLKRMGAERSAERVLRVNLGRANRG
jgi:glycosyl transferase family 25